MRGGVVNLIPRVSELFPDFDDRRDGALFTFVTASVATVYGNALVLTEPGIAASLGLIAVNSVMAILAGWSFAEARKQPGDRR